MRLLTWFIGIIASIALLSGCGIFGGASNAQPPVVQTTSATVEASVSPAPSTMQPRLHWTAIPADLDMLRRSYEGNGYAMFKAGYTPIAEHVDNPTNPTVLVTEWLGSKADVLIETHSSDGIVAVTLRKSSHTHESAKFAWYRCDVEGTEGMKADFVDLVKKFQGLKAKAFSEACREVLYS